MIRTRSAAIVLMFILCALSIHAAKDPFSTFNRDDLSYPVREERRQRMIDTATLPWFSLYDTCARADTGCGVRFAAGSQSIDLNVAGVAALEYFSKSSRFGVLSGDVDYLSPYLSARISVDVYSTERQAQSPVGDIQYERFIKEGAQVPMTGVFDFRVNLPEAYMQTGYKALTLSIGKQKLRWGPGYKGTLGMSGTAYSPFYYYHLNLAFGNLFNMKAFLCGYDDETIYRKELSITDKITVKANRTNLRESFPRYCAGQRLDIRIGRLLQIGIYELVDFFDSNELNRFANPLQIYYISNEASGTNNANLLGGMDFNLFIDRLRLYGEFVNDDITVMDKSGNPDKYGFQLGAAFYGEKHPVHTGVEFTHVARYVYGHSRVLSRHAHWGESMGWPWGNYQDCFTAYGVFTLPHGICGKIEGNLWISGDGSINDDWYAEGKPNLEEAPFFPEDNTTRFSAAAAVEYTPRPWITYSLTLEPVFGRDYSDCGVYTYLRLRVPAFGRRIGKED